MIPLEDFFRKPERAGVRLSPNGARIAWLAPVTFETETGSVRRMNLFVAELGAAVDSFDPASALQRTAISARPASSKAAGHHRHVVSLSTASAVSRW